MTTHLSRQLPWDNLGKCYSVVVGDPGIKLPVGDCGLIHLDAAATRKKVEMRPFLQDRVCKKRSCQRSSVSQERTFFKKQSPKTKVHLGYIRDRKFALPEQQEALDYFVTKFQEVLAEFAETERQKYSQAAIEKAGKAFLANTLIHNACNHHSSSSSSSDSQTALQCKRSSSWRVLSFDFVYEMIEDGNVAELLYLQHHKQLDLKQYFEVNLGGQAVGNGHRFLSHFLIKTYMFVNCLLATGPQDTPIASSPSSSSPLSSLNNPYFNSLHTNSFLQELLDDCDGRTFLENSRPWLLTSLW